MMRKLGRWRSRSVAALSATFLSACAILGGPPEPPQLEAEAVVPMDMEALTDVTEDVLSDLAIQLTGSALLDDGTRRQIYGRYKGLLGALVTVELAPAQGGTRVSAEVEKTEATEDEQLARQVVEGIQRAAG